MKQSKEFSNSGKIILKEYILFVDYQGEWNSQNQRDGKGITIDLNGSMVIANYTNDLENG